MLGIEDHDEITYRLLLPQMTTVVLPVIASVGNGEVGKIDVFTPSLQGRKITHRNCNFPYDSSES